MADSDILQHLGAHRSKVQQALARIEQDDVVTRIWARDYTLWGDTPSEIANRLGWLTAPETMQDKVGGLTGLASTVRADGYTHALLLGMGGSSLAPEVLRRTFGVADGLLDLAVLDSTDPSAVQQHADRLDPARTLFLVSTKSGTTVETLSFFKFFYNRVAESVGAGNAGNHFIAITDPGSPLADLAQRYGFRTTFLNDPDIGGRYSALSYFGLVPAALIGLDVPRLLARAASAQSSCRAASATENDGALLGAVIGALASAGRDKLTLLASPGIEAFGDWVEQLIAESTGKQGRGILPIVAEPLGQSDVYGDDRLFVHMHLEAESAASSSLRELADAGHPVVHLPLRDLYDLGAQFFLWEMATAVAGHLLAINPFDQPNVESSKALTKQAVAEYKQTGYLPGAPSAPLLAASLLGFLAQAQEGDYIAVQAYLPPAPEVDDALAAFRVWLRNRFGLATTVGYGPRYLHSTGQLHKGDTGRGLFIQFTADHPAALPIPDDAGSPQSSITFGILQTAQALGDYQALTQAGRRVIRFHLGDNPVAGLRKLMDTP